MGRSPQAGAGSPAKTVKSVRLSSEALQELAEAASWYETRQPGLAIRFLEDMDRAQQAIQSRPQSFPLLANMAVDLAIRRTLLPRFPYALVFFELPTEIRVLAIAHAKRHPHYWLNRLQTT